MRVTVKIYREIKWKSEIEIETDLMSEWGTERVRQWERERDAERQACREKIREKIIEDLIQTI